MTVPRLIAWLAVLAGVGLAAAEAASAPAAGPPPPLPSGRSLFRTYGPDQGLIEPTISCLAQDARSFLWIGTETGLVRYDGRSFRRFTRDDGLPASWVTKILQGSGDILWLVTTQGLAQMRDGRISLARFAPEGAPGKPDKTVVDVDRHGRLWVLRRDAVYHDTGAGRLEPVPGRPPGRSRALACSRTSDAVYVAIGDTVFERRSDGGFFPLGAIPFPADEEIEGLQQDGTGRLWAVSTRRLAYRDPGGVFVDATGLLPGTPFTEGLLGRGGGSVLVPTNAGLLVLSGATHEAVDHATGLPSRWVRTALIDHEGNLWVAGPNLYRRLGRGLVRAFTAEDGLPSDVVWVVRRFGGRLVVGTNDGVAWLTADGWRRLPGTRGLAASAMEMDAEGRLWLAFSNGPLAILKPGERRPSAAPFKALQPVSRGSRAEAPPQPGTPYALLPDADGTMLVGDDGVGLFRADLGAGTLAAEFTRSDAGVAALVVLHMAAGVGGTVLAATSQGLLRRDATGWRLFTEKDGLAHPYVAGVLPEDDGSSWVWYQESAGADRVVEDGGRLRVVEHLGAATGLASDHVYALIKAPDGALWASLNRGVDRILDGTVQHFGRSAGLVGEDCCANGSWCDSDGTVWVGTATGLARIVMPRRPVTPNPPATFITRVEAGRASYELPTPQLVRAEARDATLEVRWASPTFVDEKAIFWETRMVGLGDGWRRVDEPLSRYARLPGGRYRFEVRARFPGNPPGPTAAFDLEVQKVWWRTWPVAVLGCVLLLALGVAVVRLRTRVLARQKARLEELVARRTDELSKANQALAAANQALAEASLTDPLTGLRNRRYLSLVVAPEVARVRRLYAETSVGLALPSQDIVFFMIDLDHFKAINDTHGHPVGDDVLRATATALQAAARSSDSVVRWGGEEFLLVAHGTNRADAPRLAERIRGTVGVDGMAREGGSRLVWTCSVGFAALPFDPRHPGWLTWERVVELADAALYLAKRAGRHAWCGIAAGRELRPHLHETRLRDDVTGLVRDGILEVVSSRPVPR